MGLRKKLTASEPRNPPLGYDTAGAAMRTGLRSFGSLGVIIVIELAGSCGKVGKTPTPAAYRGTVIVGADYVQVLASAPDDRGCAPRVHRENECVRSPPVPGHACLEGSACIQSLSISAGSRTSASAGSFVKIPWLGEIGSQPIALTIKGCGGKQTIEFPMGPQPKALEGAMAPSTVLPSEAFRVDFEWAAESADLVCSLAVWRGARELCCGADDGSSIYVVPEQPTDLRLSRAATLAARGGLTVYRTSETANLVRGP